ncbi:hypothetical protein BK133_13970 [Paenibacillus sp. FSL H8-0548]|uniref:stalk domain-containing protein n=1 Tax=Paenibacillus sp. FSL H8-0548 TaxID=1920422 RepID=UPI00096C8A25|nr:stalk domain-containing protein [Paenibacillus sp. FSL H8-0548]OMF32611.1 hypothetical protein BK133_13970 [Paenibacillus sp. FSL H8-0548]
MKQSRILSIFLVAMMLSSVFAAAVSAATTTIKVKTQQIGLQFDGQALKLPDGQYSFIYEGRTYVPIRYISYALQKSVHWDGAKAAVSEPTEKELAALKKQLQSAAAGSQKPQASVEIAIQPVKASLVFDGKTASLPSGQSIYNYKGSIYVPIRFLSESVGTQISFDPITKTVSGESAAYRAGQGTGGGAVDGGTTGNAGSGGTGGGVVKPTYEQITADTELKLAALKESCWATLTDIGLQYLAASAVDQPSIKEKGLQKLNNCSVKFEAIMSDATAKLTTNGYSTDIIATYRDTFNKELEAGRALAEGIA